MAGRMTVLLIVMLPAEPTWARPVAYPGSDFSDVALTHR
jgi:hypothetical protein